MAVDEAVTGENSIAITGTATGSKTVGVLGRGDAQGVREKVALSVFVE
jgi:hypothetical protein